MYELVDHTYYDIEDTQDSESAIILFAHHPATKQNIVMKKLRQYEDTRYSQLTLNERQSYQLEALEWNRKFTSDIYIGLAPVCETHTHLEKKPKRICIGSILENPNRETLNKTKEYVLLMKRLPKERRLDNLLSNNQEKDNLQEYLYLFTRYISHIHTTFPISIREVERTWWGSIEQLRNKLQENLELLKVAILPKTEQHDIYDRLKTQLPKFLEENIYQEYFKRRLDGHHIKRCHGDLKAPNIWIAPISQKCNEQPRKCIWLLDTIDFNPSFCNIDTLSDFAFLVVDIHTRTGSIDLANSIIDTYLRLTQETGEPARYVLAYYLIEKAAVGAAISYYFDQNLLLGNSYLSVAALRLDELMNKASK